MEFPVIEFPSSMFSWSGGVAHCEASDMMNRHLQPLPDTASGRGFAIKSTKTGAVVNYTMTEVVYDKGEEPELLGWKYVPTHDSVMRVPGCANTKAIVYND